MRPSRKSYVYSTPRHYRALYFVETDIDRNLLLDIIHSNLKLWGGRYNAIIPVEDNKIEDEYLKLVNALDPDLVYYTENIDIDEIKKVTNLQPLEYVVIVDQAIPYQNGIDYHYLLNESNRQFLNYNETLPILHIQNSHLINLEAKEFFQTNFALFDLYANQDHLIRGFDITNIIQTSAQLVNQTIAARNPYFKSILSQLKINACVFRSKTFDTGSKFELIVSDPSRSNDDLFYFWNRQQYIEPGSRLRQFVVTLEDLEILKQDAAFGQYLDRMKIQECIYVTSRTIATEEVEKIKDDLQNRFKRSRFKAIEHKVFPYEIHDSRFTNELKDDKFMQIFTGDSDLLKIPQPQLTNRVQPRGGYMVDIEVKVDRPGEGSPSHLLFPHNYNHYKGRINKEYRQTIQAGMGKPTTQFGIPTDAEVIRHRLLYTHGNEYTTLHTEIQELRYSTAGQKLNALLGLFDHNWTTLTMLLQDKYWLDILRFTSGFPKNSNIPVGKGIFSYKDLQNERRWIYGKYWERIRDRHHLTQENIDIGTEIDRYLEDDFKSRLDNTIQELIELGGLFMGVKIKCHTCGSNKWYSLKELQDKLPCKGCNTIVIPKMESTYYYRVNEIIVNNLLSDPTSNSKNFDGNYIIVCALDYLKSKSHRSFSFCCPLDYQKADDRRERWAGDIDILAIQDGKFIIGEAKLDASQFNKKELDDLIWLANTIEPDQVLLAHKTGTVIEDKIKRLREGIINSKCEIITYKAEDAKHWTGGLHGLKC